MYAPENPYLEVYIQAHINRMEELRLKEQRIHNILLTLRTVESGNNYAALGGSGEYGAYQYTPSTWKYYCMMFFGEYLDIKVPENQDKVSAAKVQLLIDKGYTDQQIAAVWNCGRPDDWEGRIGINSHGVPYNVPRYVQKFMSTMEAT